MERLTRPRTQEEADLFPRKLGEALTRLGIERGQDFVILAVKPEAPPTSIRETASIQS